MKTSKIGTPSTASAAHQKRLWILNSKPPRSCSMKCVLPGVTVMKRGPGKNFTMIEETTDIILAHISERTGRPYELVEVVKFLWTEEWLLLLTIEAKESVPLRPFSQLCHIKRIKF